MKKVEFLCLLLLFAMACHNTKNTAAEKGEAEPVEAQIKPRHPNDPLDSAKKLPALNPMDTLFASMERTPCYGRCPVYKAFIWQSGYATFEGIRFAEREGIFCARFTSDEMNKLLAKAKEIGFFKLADAYDDNVTDLPSTITAFRSGEKIKTVRNRYNGPEALQELENLFDRMIQHKQWKQIGHNSDRH